MARERRSGVNLEFYRSGTRECFDSGCYELAAAFLLDSTCPKGEEFKVHASELAQVIQDAVEDHIRNKGWE